MAEVAGKAGKVGQGFFGIREGALGEEQRGILGIDDGQFHDRVRAPGDLERLRLEVTVPPVMRLGNGADDDGQACLVQQILQAVQRHGPEELGLVDHQDGVLALERFNDPGLDHVGAVLAGQPDAEGLADILEEDQVLGLPRFAGFHHPGVFLGLEIIADDAFAAARGGQIFDEALRPLFVAGLIDGHENGAELADLVDTVHAGQFGAGSVGVDLLDQPLDFVHDGFLVRDHVEIALGLPVIQHRQNLPQLDRAKGEVAPAEIGQVRTLVRVLGGEVFDQRGKLLNDGELLGVGFPL